jgi:hypothetical protein
MIVLESLNNGLMGTPLRYPHALIGRSAAAFGAGEARAEDRRQRHQPDGMRSSGG